MSKAADWCGTWNNRTTAAFHLRVIDQMTQVPGSVEFACGQDEVSETGTAHCQCFIQLSSPRGLNFMRKMAPGAHWEKRQGTATQARDYCNKKKAEGGNDEEYWTYGVFLPKDKKGKRMDVVAFKDAIKSGATDEVPSQ